MNAHELAHSSVFRALPFISPLIAKSGVLLPVDPAFVQDVAFLLGIHWRNMTDVIGPLRLSGD